jgi:hypothetical protein
MFTLVGACSVEEILQLADPAAELPAGHGGWWALPWWWPLRFC